MESNVINEGSVNPTAKYVVDNGYTGFNTNNYETPHRSVHTPPGIVSFKGLYHIFFVDDHGAGIMHITSVDGKSWSMPASFYTGFTTSAGPCPIVIGDTLYVFFRDGEGNGLLHIHSSDGEKWEAGPNWYTGLNIDKQPSAAVLNKRVCVIGRDHNGKGIMRAVKDFPDGKWDNGYTGYNANVNSASCIVAFGDLFHIFFMDGGGKGIMHITSPDGIKWSNKSSWYTGFNTSAGPCAIVFNNILHVFFRDGSGNGVLYIQSKDGDIWSAPADWYFKMNCDYEPSIAAATGGKSMCLACIDHNGSGIMRSVFTNQ